MKAGENSNNQSKASNVCISLQSGRRSGKSSSIDAWGYVKSVNAMDVFLLELRLTTLSRLARAVRMNYRIYNFCAFPAIAGKLPENEMEKLVLESQFSNLIFPVGAQIIKQPIAERLEKSFTPPPFENFSHSGFFPKRFFRVNSVSCF